MNKNVAPESAKKLTKWSKEPDIKDLKQDLEAAKQAQRSHITKIRSWRDLMNVSGSGAAPKVKGRSSVQPRLIRRQAEWRYSALTEPFLGSSKMFKISPVSWEDTDSARQNELILNWQFRTKLNPIKFIDEFVRTTVDEGTCIIRLGWMRETKIEMVEVPVYNYYAAESPEDMQALEAAMLLMSEDPKAFKELPDNLQKSAEYTLEMETPAIAEDSGKTEKVKQEKVLFNQPTLDMINPENIYIDPSCQGDLNKARFIIMSFETSKGELMKDKRYTNLKAVNFGSAGILATPDHETTVPDAFQFNDELRKRIVAYEYWGLWDVKGDDNLVPIVATWIGDTLIRMEANPFPDEKPPFVLVPYMPIKRSIFGETDAELLEDNQKILGALTRGMIDMMGRSANGQTGMAKGMLDTTNKRRFDNGQDYEYNPNQNPQQGLVEHKYPEIPQSAMLMLQLQNQEAEALTGVKAFSGGMSGNAYGDVAAGIRGLLDAASKREMAILRRLARGMQEIGHKIVMMNQQFLSEEEVVRVTNEQFITIRREDLGGHFDMEVDISTAEVDNAKAQDLGFMMQTIGPDMEMQQRNLILGEVAQLKRMPELAHMLRNYQPQPDPLAEELQKMEIEKLRLEVAKLGKEVEEIDSVIQLNMAKAKEADARADMANLNFVEQETGTKHERDMQKQGAQADANKELEVTKSLLKPLKDNEKKGSVEAAVGYNELTKPDAKKQLPPPPAQQDKNFTGRNYGQDVGQQVSRPVDQAGNQNPVTNIGSQYFDAAQDPTLNQRLNL
jgi:hypothetical protein